MKNIPNFVVNLSKINKNNICNEYNKVKNKFFCDCNINTCYCFNNGKNSIYNNNYVDNLIQNKYKKLTKNQSNKNYEYLMNQWLF